MSLFLQHNKRKMSQPSKPSCSGGDMNTWMKTIQNTKVERNELNKIVMNYLVLEGYKEAAEKFRLETGIETCQPLDLLDNRIRIREAVQAGTIDEAIDLTNSLNPELLDSKPHLFFHLQQQKLIELIRDKNIEEALEFSQNVMAELGTENNDYLEELEKTMGLLAYENPESSPFGELLNISQRSMVASELNAAILEAEHMEMTPNIAGIMKLLLWSQNELDKKHVNYPKMIDIANGTIKNSAEDKNTTITIT